MKVYRIVLAVILVFIIGFGVWYCISTYNEQRSNKDGLLVWDKYAIQWNVEQAGDE